MWKGLREALQIHQINCYTNSYDLIFCSKNGTPIDPNNMVKQQFQPALVRAGLKRISFHGLRHTNVALRIQKGEHPKFIQEQIGHGSIQMTMDLYGHLFPSSYNNTYGPSGHGLDDVIFGENKTIEPASGVSKSGVVRSAAPGEIVRVF